MLKLSCKEYSSNPQPDDILLVVEISDSTVHFDLNVKDKLYARAEISEYWVVNIPKRQLVVHREPNQGMYNNVKTYNADEETSPVAAPSATICLNRLYKN